MVGILQKVVAVANWQIGRPLGFRDRPEVIVLAARADMPRSAKPPVRIFVGTESGQHRAERIFLWSIEQARDPSRVYELHLMADLRGYDRRRWLTGFTNYRFAIPHFAGGAGRAIYNDVDQVYLADPAELFDMDMGHHGFLSITPRDTSVMLIDCARMTQVWTPELTRRLRRNRIDKRTRAAGDFWGPLAREWNARDEEYVAGRSKVLHFTTIHTQPWQPFPERFVYQRNPVAQVWLDMERAADMAHYEIFSADRPSAEYQVLIERLRASRAPQQAASAAVHGLETLLAEAGAASVLDVHLASHPGPPAIPACAGRTVTRHALADASLGALPERSVDAAVCTGAFDDLPDGDIPWLMDSLFRCARRCVYLSGAVGARTIAVDDGPVHQRPPRPQSWWLTRIERASVRYPEVHWKLVVYPDAKTQGRRLLVREGGRRADGKPPTVWVLTDHKAGHTTQSIGLADAVGFPYEVKQLQFNLLNHFSNRIRGASAVGLDRTRSTPMGPPWPDLVISTGRRTAPVARWIGRQSGGRARLVQLGRRGGETVGAFDLVVSCAHFRLPMHPRRMEIIAPLNAVTLERLARAAARWEGRFNGAPHPHIVLIVGGSSSRHRLAADAARHLAEQVCALARSVGGSVFAITSPRTGAEATAAVRKGLGDFGHLHEWKPRDTDNPYMGYLALADALVVTGESESMLAEAAAAAKPLFIYPIPERPLGFRRLAEWVARQAEVRPRSARGTVRPQLGLEYICARLIEAGIVRPPRHLDRLHQGLIEAGAARAFGAPFDGSACRPLREVDAVARRVRLLLGFADPVQTHGPLPHAPNGAEDTPRHPASGDAHHGVSAA